MTEPGLGRVLLTTPARLPQASHEPLTPVLTCRAPALPFGNPWDSVWWGGDIFLKSHFIDTLNPGHSAPFEAVWKCETHTVSE